MPTCPSCAHESPAESRYCSWCAAPFGGSQLELRDTDVSSTETAVISPVSGPPVSHITVTSSSAAVDDGRFLPGTMLAGRYRIAGLLGRGGMGEVYRATDLVLGQAVALKFLPDSTASDDRALARFYNEVRIARQVTHPNVCRVYDIGQVDGAHYISMEYVDGENLDSLLRRIGRLPADKAMETARKLCAGLSAAHEKGVLHRDLKPANVMIDGRGQVVIMDFGLAGLAEQLEGDIRSGTPAYMAPEQLAGTGVSVRSDIYALGLLLYELFTGKRAFEAASLMELMQLQERAAPVSITSVAKDVDPSVERVILRCLQPDPAARPASALAVAAALPGGDPLAAALAAGETPSPELLAAAGETEGLRPMVAGAWLAAALAGILLVAFFAARTSITQKAPLDAPPEALARDARNLLRSFGYADKPGDRAWEFEYNGEYNRYLRRLPAAAAARWLRPAEGPPPLVDFWYRESPLDMVADRNFNVSVEFGDPAFDISGMLRLKTDPDGRLQELGAVPPQVEAPAPPGAPFDWAMLFRAAGLEMTRFQPVDPQWTPLANWDARAAWMESGVSTHPALRVEAAAWRGRPVYFRIVGPWSTPERMGSVSRSSQSVVQLAILYLALAAAAFLAWTHFRSGRADRQGAAKLAIVYFTAMVASRFLLAHHTSQAAELSLFWRGVGVAGINAWVLWIFYLALEPWVRQRWPQTLISWSRFTTKGIRDPLVGRDILFGAVLASLFASVKLVQLSLHGSSGEPVMPVLAFLLGPRQSAGAALDGITGSLFSPMLSFFLLFVSRAVLRNPWLGAAVFILADTFTSASGSSYPAVDYVAYAIFSGLTVLVLLRFGLLALVATDALSKFLISVPRTLDFSSWYAGVGLVWIVLVALIAIYGFYTSLAGRKLLPPRYAGSSA